jgi:hypothetical protein
MADFLDIIESYGDHWTIWNYKDIGKMGIVTVDHGSLWMQRIQPVHQLKTDLRADSWVDRTSTELDTHLGGLAVHLQSRLDMLPGESSLPREELGYMIGDRFIAGQLLPAFAELFRDMSESEIDEMMASFAFEKCHRRTDLENLIRGYTLKEIP